MRHYELVRIRRLAVSPSDKVRKNFLSMKRIRLLVLTGFKTLEGFQLPMENRTLLWGLDQANIEWRLYNPWKKLPDLDHYDAALVTVYWRHNVNFTFHCKR